MTGFGAFADGGLAWAEDGEVVDLRGLGDVFAQPTLNELMAAGPDQLARVREHLLHSIGSCSFFEPVGELHALGIL